MKATSADEPAGFGPSTLPQNACGGDGAFLALDENHLLQKYSGALRDWAWRYCGGNGELRNDLFQEGALGLFQAARRFDPTQGVKFYTLARRHMRGRMLNYLRSESGHRRCTPMAQACHQGEDQDGENPAQEDCLPIGATEAMEVTERFLIEVDVKLLRGVMQQCLALLTARQQEIFTMRYVDGLQPSDVARALGISPARVTQVLTESTAKMHAMFVQS
jgi:RNA polymerase sigma factor for flagellar operon FliA